MKITDNFPLSFFNDIPNGIFLLILGGSFASRSYCCCHRRRHWWQRCSARAKHCRRRRRRWRTKKQREKSIFLSHIGCASVFSMWFAALFSTRPHDTSRTHAALHLSIVVRWPLFFFFVIFVRYRSFRVASRLVFSLFFSFSSSGFWHRSPAIAFTLSTEEWREQKTRTNWNRYW